MDAYSSVLTAVRNRNPLVLQVTNTVTVNDCANITICFGAAPVISDDPADAVELMQISDALLLNLGTVHQHQLNTMCAAADVASKENKPIVLDPVGIGNSLIRKTIAKLLIKKYKIAVIKGNAAEISALSGGPSVARGVDSKGIVDRTTMLNLSRETGAVVVASGPVDIITDGTRIAEVSNGVPEMGFVSGTGCMAGSCVAAAAVVAPAFDATVSALAALGIAGEKAAARTSGPGSFKVAFFDETSHISADILKKYGKIREVKA